MVEATLKFQPHFSPTDLETKICSFKESVIPPPQLNNFRLRSSSLLCDNCIFVWCRLRALQTALVSPCAEVEAFNMYGYQGK